MATYTYSGSFPSSPSTGETLAMNGMEYTYTAQGAWEVTAGTGSEGTAVLSTGETGATKYLREDGDGTSSWQAVAGGGGIGEFIDTSIAISSDDTALANDDGTANNNIGIGANALAACTGIYNTAIGIDAGANTTINHGNSYLGWTSGQYNTTGVYNTGVGTSSLLNLKTGSHNVGVGYFALSGGTNASGSYNIGIGYQTGHSISTGQYNVLNGYQAGYKLDAGSNNIFSGQHAGYNDTYGSHNISLGTSSSYTRNGGNRNIYFGYETGKLATNGSDNVRIGTKAGYQSGQCDKSVMIGYHAGWSDTSDNKLHIANNATESLIEGDFSARTVNINGALSVNGTAVGGGGGGVTELISKTLVTSSTTAIDITGIDSKYSMIFVDYSLQGPTGWGSAKLQLGIDGVFNSAGEYTTGSNTRNAMQLDGGWAREYNAGRLRIYNLGSSTKTIVVSRHIEIEAQAVPTWLSDAQNEYFTRNTTVYNSIRITGTYGGTGYSSGYVHVYGIKDS